MSGAVNTITTTQAPSGTCQFCGAQGQIVHVQCISPQRAVLFEAWLCTRCHDKQRARREAQPHAGRKR